MKRKVYTAGDMLNKGSQLLREEQKNKLEQNGIPVYNPADDKEINDKSAQTKETNDNLAERIVYKDTEAILKAEDIVIEPQPFALGTLVELGQIKGCNDMNKRIRDILDSNNPDDIKICLMTNLIDEEIPHKTVYAHNSDIRRTNIPEVGDRRSWSINQYVYGVILDLTNNKGFQDFDDIVMELKERYKGGE